MNFFGPFVWGFEVRVFWDGCENNGRSQRFNLSVRLMCVGVSEVIVLGDGPPPPGQRDTCENNGTSQGFEMLV